MWRIRRLTQPNDNVCSFNQCASPLDSDALDFFCAVPEAGGVGQQNGHAVERQWDLDMIPRRPWYVGDDCPLTTNYSIDQAGFSGVWWARDHDPQAVLQGFGARPAQPLAQFVGKLAAIFRQSRVAVDIILVGVVDRCFRSRGQRQQHLLH